MVDQKVSQLGMIGQTTAAAVTEFRADLPDVTARDRCATQGAMGVRTRGSIVDDNEAEHVGTSTWTDLSSDAASLTTASANKDSLSGPAIPMIAIW